MLAHVYKSLKRADTYVYLARRDDFASVPEPLRASLGPLHHVLDVELTPGRRLAREDAATVRGNLAARGFHLQFPPSQAGDPLHEDWGTDA
ncbi:MAG: YcgL domain-containing protein [Lysobacteraceae bacterium]